MGCDFLKNNIAVGNNKYIIKKSGCHRIVVGMSDYGFVAEGLHQFSRKSSGGITSGYHGNSYHAKKLAQRSVEIFLLKGIPS